MRAITNAKVIANNSIKSGTVIFDNKITDIVLDEFNLASFDGEVIDAKGLYLSPGFIDIHCHGGGGADAMDCTENAIKTIARAHAKFGTTSILPTAASGNFETLLNMLKTIEPMTGKSFDGARIAGAHLEGPYFALSQVGAQNPDFIKAPDKSEYEKFFVFDCLKLMSVAPELEGATELGRELEKRGIVASIGHSEALLEDVERATQNGFSNITHFYSGCSSLKRINSYRYPGIVEAGYLYDINVEIIADGKHLPPSLLKLVVKLKGTDKVCLVTDAQSFACTDIKEGVVYDTTSGVKVIYDDGVLKLPDKSSFAGSVATTSLLVKNMINLAGCSIVDAVKMATYNPAKLIGIEKQTGSISKGLFADFVIFDDEIDIKTTIVGGNTVYNKI